MASIMIRNIRLINPGTGTDEMVDMLISGGEIDYQRVSMMLFDEYRSGKLGRITLEFPER